MTLTTEITNIVELDLRGWTIGVFYCGKEKTPNVRTVLFQKHDLSKSCWAVEDVGLLLNRYIFQSLLPLKPPADIKGFLEYVVSCLDLLNNEVASKNAKRVLIHALADTFGGYLQALALPISNELFYEGNIDVKTAVEMHVLQNDMKYTLKSDGSNWAPPTLIKGPIRPIKPLPFTANDFKKTCEKSGCCDSIIFDKKNCGNDPMSQTTASSNINLYDEQTERTTVKTNATVADIPIPFFDDCKNPHAIAVPLKDISLYSLTSNVSYGVLTKYYKISIYCLNEKCLAMQNKCKCRRSMKEFNVNFYMWMVRNVLPFLQKSRVWFPAFYEVLRVYKAVDKSVNNSTQRHLIVINESQADQLTGIKKFLHNLRFACPCLLTLIILLCILLLFCKFCYISIKKNGDEECCQNLKDVSIGGKIIRCICGTKDQKPEEDQTEACPPKPVQEAEATEAEPEGTSSRGELADTSQTSKTEIESTRSSNGTYNKNAVITYFMGLEGKRFPDSDSMLYKKAITNEKQGHKKALKYTYDSSYANSSVTMHSSASRESSPPGKERKKKLHNETKSPPHSAIKYQLEKHKHIKHFKIQSSHKKQKNNNP